MVDDPTPPAAAQIVEIVARAIEEAREQNDHIQAFDYSKYGLKKPYVIRDVSLPGGQQTLWGGDDSEACDAEYVRIKNERVASAVLTALRTAGLTVGAEREKATNNALMSQAADRLDELRAKLDIAYEVAHTAKVALVQARGALALDAMVDGDGEFYGTTTVAVEAIDEALARLAAIPYAPRAARPLPPPPEGV